MEAIHNHTDFPVLSPRSAKPPQGPGHLLVSVQSASERESSVAPKAATSWALEVPSTCSQAQHTTVIQASSALFSFRGNRANICFQLLAKLAVQARPCWVSSLHRTRCWGAETGGKDLPSKKKVLVAQLYPTLWYPLDCSSPGSSVHGILQAKILEWVAIPFSRVSSLPRDQIWVSRTAGRFFAIWGTREAPQNSNVREMNNFPFNLHERTPHIHLPTPRNPTQALQSSTWWFPKMITLLSSLTEHPGRSVSVLGWMKAEDYMVAGQGEWRSPSTHRRLRNADCVHKFSLNPCHWTRRSALTLPGRKKSQSPLPETPYQKHVRLQRKWAMSHR